MSIHVRVSPKSHAPRNLLNFTASRLTLFWLPISAFFITGSHQAVCILAPISVLICSLRLGARALFPEKASSWQKTQLGLWRIILTCCVILQCHCNEGDRKNGLTRAGQCIPRFIIGVIHTTLCFMLFIDWYDSPVSGDTSASKVPGRSKSSDHAQC